MATAGASLSVGWSSMVTGDLEQAVRHVQEVLSLSKMLGWQAGVRQCINTLGAIAARRGDYASAAQLFQERLRLEREAGDPLGVASAIHNMAFTAFRRGDHLRARDLAEDAFRRYVSLDARVSAASSLNSLGFALLALGDAAGAAKCLKDALITHGERGIKEPIADVIEAVARVAAAQGDMLSAARLLGTKDALRTESFGIPSELDVAQFETTAQRTLGPGLFESAQAEGAAWSVEQATQVAMDILERTIAGSSVTATISSDRGLGLTRREQEVAGLIAQGLSNREIAKRLFISERTADTHVQHILNKLGFNSRTQIAAWAVQHGLALAQ